MDLTCHTTMRVCATRLSVQCTQPHITRTKRRLPWGPSFSSAFATPRLVAADRSANEHVPGHADEPVRVRVPSDSSQRLWFDPSTAHKADDVQSEGSPEASPRSVRWPDRRTGNLRRPTLEPERREPGSARRTRLVGSRDRSSRSSSPGATASRSWSRPWMWPARSGR